MSEQKRKIGIFGGTFNPVHYGHLLVAENALYQFGLETVIFLPTGISPHKPFMGNEMCDHRCRMLDLAIHGNSHFTVSRMEIDHPETSYTYRTLEKIKNEYPGAELFFILGADALTDFEKWRHPEQICSQASILAAVRGNMEKEQTDEQISYLNEKFGEKFFRLESPNFSVCSNEIRCRVQNGATVRYMLPEAVEQYIYDHHLYLSRDN